MDNNNHFVKVIAAVVLLSLAGCSPKIIEHVTTEYKDSVRVDIRERIVHDTVVFSIPVEVEKIVTLSDSSHLENRFSKSDAYVRDGMLHHTLETIKQDVDIPVEVTVSDTTTAHTSTSIEQNTTTQIEYIEKKLSWFQKTEIVGFWVLLAALVVIILWRKVKWTRLFSAQKQNG